MTFEETMNRFWAAQFTPSQREQVELDWDYQNAVAKQDVSRAQEIACKILLGDAQNRSEFIALRVRNRLLGLLD
jgi:hypothetical protein